MSTEEIHALSQGLWPMDTNTQASIQDEIYDALSFIAPSNPSPPTSQGSGTQYFDEDISPPSVRESTVEPATGAEQWFGPFIYTEDAGADWEMDVDGLSFEDLTPILGASASPQVSPVASPAWQESDDEDREQDYDHDPLGLSADLLEIEADQEARQKAPPAHTLHDTPHSIRHNTPHTPPRPRFPVSRDYLVRVIKSDDPFHLQRVVDLHPQCLQTVSPILQVNLAHNAVASASIKIIRLLYDRASCLFYQKDARGRFALDMARKNTVSFVDFGLCSSVL